MRRREALVGMVALAVGAVAKAQGHETAGVDTVTPTGDFAEGSRVFRLSEMKPVVAANGARRLSGFHGTIKTGEAVGMHESWTPAGVAPPTLHVIHHTEMIAVLEGEVEFVHEDKRERAVAGDVIYVEFGTNHYIKNVGSGTARYMVFAVGGDAK